MKNLYPILFFLFCLFFVFGGNALASENNSLDKKLNEMTEDAEYDATSIIVKYKEGKGTKKNRAGFMKDFPFEVVRVSDNIKATTAGDRQKARIAESKTEKENVRSKLKEYLQNKDVLYAEPNFVYRNTVWTHTSTRSTPNDYNVSNHWYYENSKLPEAWHELGCPLGAECDFSDVTVAVIDTGLAFENYDDTGIYGWTGKSFLGSGQYNSLNLYTNAGETQNNGIDDDCNGLIDDYHGVDIYAYAELGGADFATCNSSNVPYNYSSSIYKEYWKPGHPVDTYGHGTFVTGQIASKVDDSLGSVSPAFTTKIMPLAASVHYERTFYLDDVTTAMAYANYYGADIINLSLGSSNYSQTEQDIINIMRANGIVIVAATGNDGASTISYPAAYDGVISVGALNNTGTRASYSNYGSQIDLVAYSGTGSSLGNANYQTTLSCYPNCSSISDYTLFAEKYSVGTSFASPQVAAAAAMVKGLYPNAGVEEIEYILKSSTQDIGDVGFDYETGKGALRFDMLNDSGRWTDWVYDTGYTDQHISMISFDSKLYQTVKGLDNKIYSRYSSNGTTWTPFVYSTGYTKGKISNIVFDSKLYQAVRGMDSKVWTRYTTDGTTWTPFVYQTGVTPGEITMEVFDSKLYQTVRGMDSKVWTRYTTDGTTWTPFEYQTGITPGEITMEVFDSKLYQTVRGMDSKVWTRYTTDGLDWTPFAYQTGVTPGDINMNVFNSKLYQTVRGMDNRVWTRYTVDGANWTNFEFVGGFTYDNIVVEISGGKMYQSVRGVDNKAYTRSTSDGINWTYWGNIGNFSIEGLVSMTDFNGVLYQTGRTKDLRSIKTRNIIIN